MEHHVVFQQSPANSVVCLSTKAGGMIKYPEASGEVRAGDSWKYLVGLEWMLLEEALYNIYSTGTDCTQCQV